MQRLHELQSLITLSQALGQEPDPAWGQELQQLQEREAGIRARARAAAQTLLEAAPEPAVTVVQPEPAPEPESMVEATPEPAATMQRVMDILRESTVVGPEPALVSQPTDALEKKVQNLERWISRIAATGPGGGAAQIYNLDIPVRAVTGNYTVGRKDYYIGVSSSVKTYITLPTMGSNLKDGRVIVIKDESGRAQLTPIAIVGTIDNDPNGAEIRVNNGALQLVWRNNGWRII